MSSSTIMIVYLLLESRTDVKLALTTSMCHLALAVALLSLNLESCAQYGNLCFKKGFIVRGTIHPRKSCIVEPEQLHMLSFGMQEHPNWQMKSGSVYFQLKWIMTVNARACEFESVCRIFIVTGEDTLNISMVDFPVAFFSFHSSGSFQL